MAIRVLPFTLAAILLLLCIPFVFASPPLNSTSTHTLSVTYCPSSMPCTRSLWDIIRSCAATLFACTWTAIHPNVPGMKEGRVVIFCRRLFIMVLALIAPELMITWATIQYGSACTTAKAFNKVIDAQPHRTRNDHPDIEMSSLLSKSSTSDESNDSGRNVTKWTTTHGFFAWMGGFMLYCDDKPRAPLTPDELKRFVGEGYVDMPNIDEADIESRSKSDALSKLAAILQLVWFVLQLIARYIQNLPTTLLEIDTMAIVTLACIAYFWWFHKPKDVRRPYPVHWKKNKANPPALHTLTYEKENSEFSLNDWHDYFIILIYPMRSLMGTCVTISRSAVQQHRIPSLGGYDDQDRHDGNHVFTLVLGCVSGVIYGGLHCLGWNSLFLGYRELMLWRAASIVMMFASLLFLLIFGLVIVTNYSVHDSWPVKFPVAIVFFVYVIARITLIVLILLSLRSQYPGIYETVVWDRFLPHF